MGLNTGRAVNYLLIFTNAIFLIIHLSSVLQIVALATTIILTYIAGKVDGADSNNHFIH